MIAEIHLTQTERDIVKTDWARLDCWQRTDWMNRLRGVSHHFCSPVLHVRQHVTSIQRTSECYCVCSSMSACVRGELCVLRKHHVCTSPILVCSHPVRATEVALARTCWHISLPAVCVGGGETLMSTWWVCTAHLPLWTNKIRVKMKSIIIADIFISGVPYLITNFFQGILKEFLLWVNLSLLLSYVYSIARGWRLHT